MKTKKTKLMLILTLLQVSLYAQEFEGLHHMLVGKTHVYYSDLVEVSAQFSGEISDGANAFFYQFLEPLEVECKVLVLSKKDWPSFTYPNLIYGMPHYVPEKKALFVAAEDNAFWTMQLPDFASLQAPFNEMIPMVYSFNGEKSARYFFDLLAIHELGHAWQGKAKLNTQRLWMMELLCNLMLHTYIAEERGEFLQALEVLPMYWSSQDKDLYAYTTLAQFDSDYNKIGPESPRNYAWYQYRFHNAARILYNEGGAEILKNLWDFLSSQSTKLSDEELLEKLTNEVHPYFETLINEW
ncbi:MAG: hypothetical protein JJU28_22690 [Cyclobacteriaceae bacterium]|nr:hypothetical protein [Cyclobacteriaceae bacterium]